MIDQKEFLKMMKAIFYQLFNRKLPFVVFERSYPTDLSFVPKWLFTNVDYDTILMYDSKPDYFYQEMTLLDDDFQNKFYTLFPLLKSVSCLIRVVDFVSSLSKATDITQCSLNLISNDIVMSYPEKDRIVDKVIGVHLLDIDVEMYRTIYASGLIQSSFAARKFLTADDLSRDKFIMEVDDGESVLEHPHPRQARIIVQTGLTVPSLPTFLKNIKLEGPLAQLSQQCVLESGYDGDSVLVNSKYSNNYFACIGTQPAQRWFVHLNQINKESNHGGSETNKAQEQYKETRTEQGMGREDSSSEGEKDAGGSSCGGNCETCSGSCGRKETGTEEG